MLEAFKISSKTRMSTITASFQREKRKSIRIVKKEIKSSLFAYMRVCIEIPKRV